MGLSLGALPGDRPQLDPTMILKNLWRRKTRTLLTMLGIAIGVAAVVALSAFGEGLASGMGKVFADTRGDIMVTQKEALASFLSVVDADVGDEIQSLPGVDEVTGTVAGIVQMQDAPYFIVMGEDPRSFTIDHYKLVAGQPLSGRRQLLLGRVAARNFKKGVGDTFRLHDATYRIVGLYETGVSLEDGGAVMSLADAQRAFDKVGKVNYFNVKVKDPRRIDEVKQRIETTWPDLAAARSGEATKTSEMLDMYRSFGLFLGIFAVLVGGLGMMNTMLMSVMERTREIGVLRAIGWRRRRIVLMILGEALVMALVGGLVGIALGVGLTMLVRLSPAVETLLQGVFRPDMFAQALVIALLLGGLGGVYPAWRASRLAPVEAMRQEGGSVASMGRVSRFLARNVPLGAFRNLVRRPGRTLVTVVGIGIGVGFIFALSAMTEGMKASFTAMAGAGEADLIVEQANASDLSLSKLDERLADRLSNHAEVEGVSKILFSVTNAPGLAYFLIFGADPTDDWMLHYRVHEGRSVARPKEIMLGRFAANSLKKGLGDEVRLAGSSYEVVGIYETGVSYEDAGGVVLLKDAQERFGMDRKVSLLAVKLRDPSRVDSVAAALEAQYPEATFTRAAAMVDRTQDFATTYTILNALIVLTVIVGGIVMMNAMLMSVFERTQEIGVLRAVGWHRRRILRMVVGESLALGVLSALAGIVIGVALNGLFLLIPGMGAFLAPAYSPPVFAAVIGLAAALGVIGALYPAWRATRMQPIEALRYE